jgi:flagellar hook-associated protein 2
MDTDAVISQLMAIESQGKSRLLGQQYRTEARKSALDQVATKLRALKTATEDLRSVGTWKTVQTVESSDATRVSATFKSGAAIGSYSIEVLQLARAEQRFFGYTQDAGATQISIKAGSEPTDPTVTIDIAAGADVNAAAAAINAKTDAPAYASVVDGQLVLSAKKTGLTLTATGTQVVEDTAKERLARSAQYRIDGDPTVLESASNTITDITGIEVTLKGLTTSPVTLNVGPPGPDLTAMKAKVKAFVDAYNSSIDLIKGKLEEQPVKSPQFQSDYAKGALRGDPGLSGLLSKLRGVMSDTFTGNPLDPNPTGFDQLADIGVSVPGPQSTGAASADRLAGKLVIDDEKLTAALTTDPGAVRRLLGGLTGVDGASQAINAVLDPVARVGDGDLAKRGEMIDREVARIKDQQLAMDRRLKLKEERLRAQFTAMETALSQSQSSMSWLSGQISGLASWSS